MFISRHRPFYSQVALHFRLVLVLLLLQWFSQHKRGINAKPFKKVVKGNTAPRGRFPYMCSLRRRGDRKHVCGGTLIKSRWVLTAAHCVDSQHAGMSPIVYCNIYERKERNSNKAFTAHRTYVHPQWNGNVSEGYDIALIKLDTPSDSLFPDLDTQGSVHSSGRVFSALGWGFNSSRGFTDTLQIADHLPYVATWICNTENFWGGQIMESMICAGTGKQDTDQGDSGGPLLDLDLLAGDYTLGDPSFDLVIGITSFGERSKETFKPGVYTRVAYFRDWIDCVIEEDANCSRHTQVSTENSEKEEETSSKRTFTTSANALASQPSLSEEALSISSGSLEELSEDDVSDVDFPSDSCADISTNTKLDLTEAVNIIRIAIEVDDSETVAQILCSGLNPNTTFVSSVTASSQTLLHEAAKYDAINSAKILIHLGAGIERINGILGSRPSHVAAEYNSAKVAKLLIESGADIEVGALGDGSPLQIAAFYDSKDVAKLLIDSGADTDSSSILRSTPFNIAIEEDSAAVVKVFIDFGVDIDRRNSDNQTYLHRAARYNAAKVAKVLIKFGANVSSLDSDLETPLHYAALYGSLEVAKVLVEFGADADAQKEGKRTPLHIAARYNRVDIAKFLIDNGASKKAKDNDGNTPYDEICASLVALSCSALEVARLQRLLKT